MRPLAHRSRAAHRLAAAAGLSAVAVLAALVIPAGGLGGLADGSKNPGADGYKKAYAAKVGNKTAAAQGSGTIYLADGTHIHPNGLVDDGHGHSHNDPATKNSVSRSAPTTDEETADPTTPSQARAAVGAASEQRSQSEPKLSNVPVSAPQAATPTDRYNMFNGCYSLQSARTGRWLTDTNVPTFSAASEGAGTRSTSSRPHSAATCSTAPSAATSTAARPSRATPLHRARPATGWSRCRRPVSSPSRSPARAT